MSTGRQKGHEGKTLLKLEKSDNIADIRSEACECGCSLSSIEGKIQARQVFDLPKITVNVTEYRTHEIICPICNKAHRIEFPKLTGFMQLLQNILLTLLYIKREKHKPQ